MSSSLYYNNYHLLDLDSGYIFWKINWTLHILPTVRFMPCNIQGARIGTVIIIVYRRLPFYFLCRSVFLSCLPVLHFVCFSILLSRSILICQLLAWKVWLSAFLDCCTRNCTFRCRASPGSAAWPACWCATYSRTERRSGTHSRRWTRLFNLGH